MNRMPSIDRRIAAPLVVLALLMSASSGCRRHDPRMATPKVSLRNCMQAMYDNDAATAKQFILDGPGQMETAEGMTRVTAAMRRTTDAAYKRYGDEFRKMLGPAANIGQIDPQQIDGGTEKITGDMATVNLKDNSRGFLLKRVNGDWKIDLANSLGASENLNNAQMVKVMNNMCTAMANAADKTTAGINSGAYPTGRQAVQAMMLNVQQAIKEQEEKEVQAMKARPPS